MFQNITFYMLFGLPLIAWGGIFVFALMVATGIMGAMVIKGRLKFTYHKAFALTTICLALLHGIFSVLSFI